jgi:hypothetical protein
VPDLFINYDVDSFYDGLENQSPKRDAVGLLFEGIPIYKIWLDPPLDVELSLLQGTCTHIGLTAPSKYFGTFPFFIFRNEQGVEFRVQAPMCSLKRQVQRWGDGDSNMFVFLLIERASRIVRSITCLGVPLDFRRTLIALWSSGEQARDLEGSLRLERTIIFRESMLNHAYAVWTYNSDRDEFEHTKQPSKTQSDGNPVIHASRPIALALGERIQFTQRNEKLGIAAIEIGKITELDSNGNGVVLLERGNRQVRLNFNEHPHFDYAYALSRVGAEPQSTDHIMLDEEPESPVRSIMVNDLLEPYGYVSVARAGTVS